MHKKNKQHMLITQIYTYMVEKLFINLCSKINCNSYFIVREGIYLIAP